MKHGFFSCAGSYSQGVWWFRICGYGLQLKASWNQPLFSERYGCYRFIPLGGKFRFRGLKP